MKKVININFQGRVIPIEDTAYELLKQYIESLRKYFANEEGRDEIINDIESRIAELFSERLKKGATCITDADVNEIAAGMGRPEDFEAQEAEGAAAGQGSARQEADSGPSQQQQHSGRTYGAGRGRFYRNADDKILGGVCSGLANYMGIDPVILRIIFVLLFGALFWVYILLWIIIPSQSIQSNITKRLYRSSEDKVISGVCGGLAAYFNIDAWIPRLIFALPLVIGLASGTFNALWWNWHWWFGPRIFAGSIGWTLFLVYVILWIVVPVATTAAEKLEMRGERVDLNSIRDTVKEDLRGFRSKAQNWGKEVGESAQQFSQKAKQFAQETAPVARRTGNGFGHAIGVLFKAFFLLIAAIIAISLFGVFIAILFGGMVAFPFKYFILGGFWQNLLALSTLFLFLGIPVIALLTWLVRRIIGVRSRNHYLGYVFATLWFIGLVSFIVLFGSVARNFRVKEPVEDQVSITQPTNGKFYVNLDGADWRHYRENYLWFDIDQENWPFYGFADDSMMLRTVRVSIVKSKDSAFHVIRIRSSRSATSSQARELARRVRFEVTQQDSLLQLPRGFAISDREKFRNQQVTIIVEVPVGKRIEFGNDLSDYNWFNVRFNRHGGFNIGTDEDWDDLYRPDPGVEYLMTPDGPRRADRPDRDEPENRHSRSKKESNPGKAPGENIRKDSTNNPNGDYRYHGEDRRDDKKDSVTNGIKSSAAYFDIPKAWEVVARNDHRASSGGKSDLLSPFSLMSRIL